MELLYKCLTLIVAQVLSVGIRTYSITKIVEKARLKVFITSVLSQFFRLITIALGVNSMVSISSEFNFEDLIIITVYLIAGATGAVLAIRKKMMATNAKNP